MESYFSSFPGFLNCNTNALQSLAQLHGKLYTFSFLMWINNRQLVEIKI